MTVQYGACALHAGYLKLQTHTTCSSLLFTFPIQQRLRERAPLLHSMCTAYCLSCLISFRSPLTTVLIKFLITVLFFQQSNRTRRDTVSTGSYQRFEVTYYLLLKGIEVQEGSESCRSGRCLAPFVRVPLRPSLGHMSVPHLPCIIQRV